MADTLRDLSVIRVTDRHYSISNIKDSGADLPRYSSVVISPSGKFACTLSWRGDVACSDLETAREIWAHPGHFPGCLREGFWDSDSELITFAGHGSYFQPPGFRKWDVESGAVLGSWQFERQDSVSCIAAFPDSSRVVIGTISGQIGEISLTP